MVDRLARLGLEVDSSGVVRATQSMRGMERQGRNLESGTKRVGNTTTNTFQSIRRAVVAAAAVYATYRAAIRETIDVAERYERAELRTQAVLRATGNQAGLTGQQLREMADDLALGTLQSVEGVQQAQQVLLTFGDVTEDTFGRAIEAAADLGAVFGGDLASNTRRLGRLLQDPANELSALSRQGITFSDDFQSTVQALVDGGNAAEAQSMILDELSGRMGGVAREEAQGLAGAYDTLSQRLDEFRLGAAESTGIVGGLTAIINAAARGVDNLTNAFFGPSDPEEKLRLINNEMVTLQELMAFNAQNVGSFGIDEETLATQQAQLELLKQQERDLTETIQAEERARADARAAAAEARGAAVLDGIQAEIEAENQASEEKGQLLQDAHNNRLDQIAQMHVSAERLEEEGFESIQALREHYQQIEAERYRDAQQDLLREQAEAADREAEAEQKRQDKLDQIRQDALDREKAFADAKRQIQESLLADTSSTFGALSSVVESFAGRNSNAYRAAFVAQQAFAIASSIVNTQMAAAAALAPPPIGLGPVAGAPYAGVIQGLGAANVAIIAAQTGVGVAESFSAPARRQGGQVRAGSQYLVGEEGPELLDMRNATASGNIRRNGEFGGGGDTVSVTNVFQISAGVEGTVRKEIEQAVPMITEMSKRAVESAINAGGSMSRATGRRR